MNVDEKYDLAMDLFIESVIRPDEELRSHARDQECLTQLMNIREDVLEYLYTIRRRDHYGTVTVRTGRSD